MPRRSRDALDRNGLSRTARATLPDDVAMRVAEAWSNGRALILNANRPSYSERFTISATHYTLVREAILGAVDAFGDDSGEVALKKIVAHVQDTLGDHDAFPNGRMTNYTRYTKTDLEARGELERIPRSSPQRVRRAD